MIDETEGAAGRRIRRYPLFLYHRSVPSKAGAHQSVEVRLW